MLFLYSVNNIMGETICKFNGIRRRRSIREIEADYSEESEPKEMNVILLRIEGENLVLYLAEFIKTNFRVLPKLLTSKLINSINNDAKTFHKGFHDKQETTFQIQRLRDLANSQGTSLKSSMMKMKITKHLLLLEVLKKRNIS